MKVLSDTFAIFSLSVALVASAVAHGQPAQQRKDCIRGVELLRQDET